MEKKRERTSHQIQLTHAGGTAIREMNPSWSPSLDKGDRGKELQTRDTQSKARESSRTRSWTQGQKRWESLEGREGKDLNFKAW